MTQLRRLADSLQKFRIAREDMIREMGVGQPLGGSDSSRQVARLREIHEVIQIMKATIAEAGEVDDSRTDAANARSLHQDRRGPVRPEEANGGVRSRVAPWPGD